MKTSKLLSLTLGYGAILSLGLNQPPLKAASSSRSTNALTPPPETDKAHKTSAVDGNSSLSADDQARGSAADVELTRQIRRELMKDETLSTNAQNVKIITINGVVTLKGLVNSANESMKVSRIARSTSGGKSIRNELEVKGDK